MSVFTSKIRSSSKNLGLNRPNVVAFLLNMCWFLFFSTVGLVQAAPHGVFPTTGKSNGSRTLMKGVAASNQSTETELKHDAFETVLFYVPNLQDLFHHLYDFNDMYTSSCFMVIGGLYLLLGQRLYRSSLVVLGGYLSVWAGFVLLNSHGPFSKDDIGFTANMAFVSAFTLIGVLVSFIHYKVVSFFFGTIVGYFLGKAVYKFVLISLSLITGEFFSLLFFILSAGIVGLFVLKAEKHSLLVFLPMIGSFLVCFGGDHFIKSGFTNLFQEVLTNRNPMTLIEWSIKAKSNIMLAVFGVLCVVGFVIQGRIDPFRNSKKIRV